MGNNNKVKVDHVLNTKLDYTPYVIMVIIFHSIGQIFVGSVSLLATFIVSETGYLNDWWLEIYLFGGLYLISGGYVAIQTYEIIGENDFYSECIDHKIRKA